MQVGDLVRGKFGENPIGLIVEVKFEGGVWECYRVVWNSSLYAGTYDGKYLEKL